MANKEKAEPPTPAGRVFLHPDKNQIIHCTFGGKNPIDINAVKSAIKASIMLKQPRFSSLLVLDSNGREYWCRTQVRHVIIRNEPIMDDPSISSEDAVNDYLSDLVVSCPLVGDKPLLEVHLLMAHNCAVFPFYHTLGDGISLMSMLLSCCRRVDDPTKCPRPP